METEKATYLTSRNFTLCESPNVVALLLNNHKVYSILLENNCYIDVHARIYNWRHPSTQWTKGSILRFSGPNYETIVKCNRLLEIFAPVFSLRQPLSEPNTINQSPETLDKNAIIKSRLQKCAQMLNAMLINSKNKSLSQTGEYNDLSKGSTSLLQRYIFEYKKGNDKRLYNYHHLSGTSEQTGFQQASTNCNRHNANMALSIGNSQPFQRLHLAKPMTHMSRQNSHVRSLPMNNRVTLHSVRAAVDLAKRRQGCNALDQPQEVTQIVQYTNAGNTRKVSQRVRPDVIVKPNYVLSRSKGSKWKSPNRTVSPSRRFPAQTLCGGQVIDFPKKLKTERKQSVNPYEKNEFLLNHSNENHSPVNGIRKMNNRHPDLVDMDNSLQCSLTCSQQTVPAKTEGDQQTYHICVSPSKASDDSMSFIRTTSPPGKQTLAGHPYSPHQHSMSPTIMDQDFVLSIPVNTENKDYMQLATTLISCTPDLDATKQNKTIHENSTINSEAGVNRSDLCLQRQSLQTSGSVKPSGEQIQVKPKLSPTAELCADDTALNATVLAVNNQRRVFIQPQMNDLKRCGYCPRIANTGKINSSDWTNQRNVVQKDVDNLLMPGRVSNASSRVRNVSSVSLELNTPSKLESGLSFLSRNPTPNTPPPLSTGNTTPRPMIIRTKENSQIGAVSDQGTLKARNGETTSNIMSEGLSADKKATANKRPQWNRSIKPLVQSTPIFLHTPISYESNVLLSSKTTPRECTKSINSQKVVSNTMRSKSTYNKQPMISTTSLPRQTSQPITDNHKKFVFKRHDTTINTREIISSGQLEVKVQLVRDVPENIPPRLANTFLLSPVLKRTQSIPKEDEGQPVSLLEDNLVPPPSPMLKQTSEVKHILQNTGDETDAPLSFIGTASEVHEFCDVLHSPATLLTTIANVSKNEITDETKRLGCVIKKATSECSWSHKVTTGTNSRTSQHSYAHRKTPSTKYTYPVEASDHSSETQGKTTDRRSVLSIISPSGEVNVRYSEESRSSSYGSEYDESDSSDWISTIPWFSRFFTCVGGKWCNGDKG